MNILKTLAGAAAARYLPMLSLVAICSAPPLALAQPAAQLYGISFFGGQLFTIDTNTGAGTVVGDLPAGFRAFDLAAHNGHLYLSSPTSRIYEIDPITAQLGRLIDFNQAIPGGEGAMAFRADGLGFISYSDNTTGTLASIQFAATNLTRVTSEGGLAPALDGLAFRSYVELFGMSQGAAPSLYRVNLVTGQTTLVGSLGVTLSGATVGGLAFAPNGTLYAALGSTSESRLYRVNPDTGAAALVGSIGIPRISGIEFFTPPPGPLLIARGAGEVQIIWPHSYGGKLQTADVFDGTWTDAGANVTTNGPDVIATISPAAGRAFYRLVR